jgi:4-amino-4-deoxy-L-arabinose transferase-like glycosyltransferase
MIKVRRGIIILGFIFLAALALRLYALDRFTLWYDEVITVLDYRAINQLHPLGQIFDRDFIANHHDYLTLYSHGFVYYWAGLLGKSEFALRLSSVIFALLSIFILYLIARRFFDTRIAYLASLFLAVSPWHVYYAQELRPYAAAAFLTLLCVYSLLGIIRSDKKIHWLLYFVASVLNAYCLYTNLLILCALFIFGAYQIKKEKKTLKGILSLHLLILLAITPLLVILYHNLTAALQGNHIYGLSDLPIWAGGVGWKNLLFTLKNFSIGYNTDYYSFAGILATFASFYFFIKGVVFWRKNLLAQLLLWLAFIPVLFLCLILKIKIGYVDRYFFPLLPLYVLGVAAGIRSSQRLFFPLTFMLALSFIGLCNYYANLLPQEYNQHIGVAKRQDIRGAFGVIRDNYKEGDLIVHTCRNTVFPLKFYLGQNGLPPGFQDEINKGKVIFSLHGIDQLLALEHAYKYPVMFSPEKAYPFIPPEGNYRVWVFFSSFGDIRKGIGEYRVVDWFSQRLEQQAFYSFEGANLYLFSNIKG